VSDHTYIRIGKLGAPYGVHGFMRLQSYADPVAQVLTYTLYTESSAGAFTPFLLADSTAFNNGKLIVKPAGVETPEAARLLTGTILYMSRAELPPLSSDQFYWHDLIGLCVVNAQGQSLGQVDSVFNAGASDVLVDLLAKRIDVEWEG